MSPRKMGPNGWEVEDNATAPASKVNDKDAAKAAKYWELEKEYASRVHELEVVNKQMAEMDEIIDGLRDKLAQVEELGYTFNESGVLIAPDDGAKAADDPARP